MTAEDAITIFQRLNVEGRATVDLDHTIAGFAGWLAEAWHKLDDDAIALLTSVGATLYREGLEQRQKSTGGESDKVL
ncbi:hypothetical protein BCF11_0398 [Collimonas sp. PA-H2]|uniref:hypothetical protein n=1 Tax=Collimonas sp. PA-H2 TaxID=1881062 RepID=UPI000BF99641|nr:hypothetical protein [Collimonas sp. PA-H2]PFH08046.1 hypothetical protein BCF11_0398 [Collimonas sp. PA-H2]